MSVAVGWGGDVGVLEGPGAGRGVLVAVGACGTEVSVAVGGTRVGLGPPFLVGWTVLVAVARGSLLGVGEFATATTEEAMVGVLTAGVAVGPLTNGRGVAVGSSATWMLTGVVVGAFTGASITTTSSVGISASSPGVGVTLLNAIWVRCSATSVLPDASAIGGSRISLQGW